MVRGRRPEERSVRDEVLKVRLTQELKADVEATRGAESRSQFARAAIEERVRARKGAS